MNIFEFLNKPYKSWIPKKLDKKVEKMGKLGWDFVSVLWKGKYKGRKCKVILKAFFSFVFGTYDRKAFEERAEG